MCVGVLSAARVCFALSISFFNHQMFFFFFSFLYLTLSHLFHLVLALLMIKVKNSSDWRASIQDGWWIIKVLVVIGLTVVAYLIPNPFFIYFGTLSSTKNF
jgi:hypothetical protein